MTNTTIAELAKALLEDKLPSGDYANPKFPLDALDNRLAELAKGHLDPEALARVVLDVGEWNRVLRGYNSFRSRVSKSRHGKPTAEKSKQTKAEPAAEGAEIPLPPMMDGGSEPTAKKSRSKKVEPAADLTDDVIAENAKLLGLEVQA